MHFLENFISDVNHGLSMSDYKVLNISYTINKYMISRELLVSNMGGSGMILKIYRQLLFVTLMSKTFHELF